MVSVYEVSPLSKEDVKDADGTHNNAYDLEEVIFVFDDLTKGQYDGNTFKCKCRVGDSLEECGSSPLQLADFKATLVMNFYSREGKNASNNCQDDKISEQVRPSKLFHVSNKY